MHVGVGLGVGCVCAGRAIKHLPLHLPRCQRIPHTESQLQAACAQWQCYRAVVDRGWGVSSGVARRCHGAYHAYARLPSHGSREPPINR